MLKRKARKNKNWSNNKCRNCGMVGHTAFMCFDNPRPKIKQESDKHKSKRIKTTRAWHKVNKPNKAGLYECYLKISPRCSIYLIRPTMEHVYPKNKYPELRDEPLNLKSACEACNKLKLSNTINQLIPFYPRLAIMVSTKEWVEWERQMQVIADRLKIRLDSPHMPEKWSTAFKTLN